MSLGRLALLLRTLRHLRMSQIVSRARRMARVRRWALLRTPAPRVAGAVRNPAFRSSWAPRLGQIDLQRGRELAKGRFEFLGVVRERPSWSQQDVSQLWRFHLHYFDYAVALTALAPEAAFAAFQALVRSWIDENGTLAGDGWHPYTVSLRIVNWCEAGAHFAANIDADTAFSTLFQASLYGQARFLAGNLETDVGGNHLIKNLRGLLWASAYFSGPEAARWRAIALSRLRREIAEQVLPDGGHFERVPAYHVQVLDDLRACSALLAREGDPQPWLNDTVTRMIGFLRAILPADGRLPLLKDTTLEQDVSDFVSLPQPSRFLSSSGFAVIRDDDRGDLLIADFGVPCPDHLPAHAHADLFSFELTTGAGPLIVDSGVYEYAAGRWRDWFRSTAAHNTMEVAGFDQSEVWGSFRVARRARPSRVRWIEHGEMRIIQGEHDGYRRLSPPVTHRRTIVVHSGLWLVFDELFGRGEVAGRSRIHLHPERHVEELNLVTFGATVERERGWYSERFGEKRENDVVLLSSAGNLPLLFGYGVSSWASVVSIMCCPGDVPEVRVCGPTAFSVVLPRNEPPRVVDLS